MSDEMLKGSPLKSIIKFSLPLYIGCVFQQLYSMVDSLIVGRTLSAEALAGVGATNSMSFLVVGFAQGMCAGFAVITSQCFGAKDNEGVKKSVAAIIVLSAVLTAILTPIATVTAKPLLSLLSTPDNIIGYSYEYLFPIYCGIGATVLYNMSASVMRALGDSKNPLIFLIIASIINIALDLLFILVFKMGVAGAGWATVISQALSGIASTVFMFVKYPQLRVRLSDFKLKLRLLFRHLAVGIPTALQFSIISIGTMIQQSALNGFGSDIIAAIAASTRLDFFMNQVLVSVGMGLAIYCGQNFGAKDYSRIAEGVNKTMLLEWGCALVCGTLLALLAQPVTHLFIPEANALMLASSQRYLLSQGCFYIVLACIFVYRNALQGMGYSAFTFLACLIEMAIRTIVAFLLTANVGFLGVCLSNPFAWIGAIILLIPAYYIIIYKYVGKSGFTAGLRFREQHKRAAK